MSVAHPLLSDRDWLWTRYVDQQMPVADIAAEAGADLSTVHLWLQRHDVPARRHEIGRADVERRLRRRQTVPEIARAYGVDPAVVHDRLYRWGLATPASAVEYDLDQLREWYEGRGWSIRRIAAEIGLSPRTATRVLLAAGARIRPPGRRRH